MPKHRPVGVGLGPTQTELGRFVRERRLALDLRQVLLSKIIGLGPGQLSRIELGKGNHLGSVELKRLAEALQCDVEELQKRIPAKHVAEPKTELGKLIRSRREELKLSIPEFAKKLGMTKEKAWQLELRRTPTIRYSMVKPLSVALDLPASTFAKFVGQDRKQGDGKLGQLVRSRRKELGMSSVVLAQKLGVTRQYVSSIEQGLNNLSQSGAFMKRLAEVLELDVGELLAIRPARKLRKVMRTSRLGDFLAARRFELCLTQSEAATRAGISLRTVSAVETGRRLPGRKVLGKLSKALGCEIPPELIPFVRVRKRGVGRGGVMKRDDAFGAFVTTRRMELGLSQEQFAEKAGTSQGTMSGIERGAFRVGEQVLKGVLRALGCEVPAEIIPKPGRRGRPPKGMKASS